MSSPKFKRPHHITVPPEAKAAMARLRAATQREPGELVYIALTLLETALVRPMKQIDRSPNRKRKPGQPTPIGALIRNLRETQKGTQHDNSTQT